MPFPTFRLETLQISRIVQQATIFGSYCLLCSVLVDQCRPGAPLSTGLLPTFSSKRDRQCCHILLLANTLSPSPHIRRVGYKPRIDEKKTKAHAVGSVSESPANDIRQPIQTSPEPGPAYDR